MYKYLLIIILGWVLGACDQQQNVANKEVAKLEPKVQKTAIEDNIIEAATNTKADAVANIVTKSDESLTASDQLSGKANTSEERPSAEATKVTDTQVIDKVISKTNIPVQDNTPEVIRDSPTGQPSSTSKTSTGTRNGGVILSESPSILDDPISAKIPPTSAPSTTVSNTSEDIVLQEPDKQKPSTKSSEEASTPSPKPEKQRQAQSKPMHSFFNYVLTTYVSDQGDVDYAGIKADIGKLDKYIDQLESFPPSDDWAKNEQLAYWINAYNAYTIKLICENYPIESIKDLHRGKPWDHKWITIDGKTLSLNDIENGIIRPRYKESRIHFAVNCAAKSCPPIANQAYTSTNLDVLLEKRTKSFINNADYNDLTKNPAMVSKIFEWYQEDFGDVVTYINAYIYDGVKPISSVDYMEYDWSLNK